MVNVGGSALTAGGPKTAVGMLLSCPWLLSPQQATRPSLLKAHVWKAPALTCLKVPLGVLRDGSRVLDLQLYSQQATVPSLLMPQVWEVPVLTCLKVPLGVLAFCTSGLISLLFPQQARLPSLFTPQVRNPPVLICLNGPLGMLVDGSTVLVDQLYRQQARVPSLSTPQSPLICMKVPLDKGEHSPGILLKSNGGFNLGFQGIAMIGGCLCFQQATLPSLLRAQLHKPPALTCVKEPLGTGMAVSCP